MDSIFNEELKEEELLSGFELLNTDDESFLLDNGVEYPGKLPYKLSPNEIKDAVASEKLIKDFLEQQKQETNHSEETKATIWNLFDEDEEELQKLNKKNDASEDENLKLGNNYDNELLHKEKLGFEQTDEDEILNDSATNIDNDIEDTTSDKLIHDNNEETVSEQYQNQFVDTKIDENNNSDEKVKLDDDFLSLLQSDINKSVTKKTDETKEQSNQIPEEEVKLDEDFLSLLQGDLNKSLLKKTDEVSNQTNPINQESNVDFNDFKPVDELEDSILIEFDSIDINKPSEIKKEEIKVKSTPTKKLKVPKNIKEKKENPEKKPRKKIALPVLPWKKIALFSYSFTFFIGVILLAYYLFFIDSETQQQIQKIKSLGSKKNNIADTIKVTKAAEKIEIETNKPQDSLKTQKDTIPQTNASIDFALNEKKIDEDLPKFSTPKKYPKNNSNNIQIPSQPNKNTNRPNNTFSITDDRIYVVEVFSTPIKEEAEKWLLRLHAEKIYDGVIRTQKIRDEIWYKVRFGNFSNYEDAKLAVLKNGIKNARIDRIK
ncbi:MAG: SPOR domain-containing protein [Candidatus Kapabacteria bacterium]|nr:SPOR domain-containing protein [Candidatus Kapabacteria bacterium]